MHILHDRRPCRPLCPWLLQRNLHSSWYRYKHKWHPNPTRRCCCYSCVTRSVEFVVRLAPLPLQLQVTHARVAHLPSIVRSFEWQPWYCHRQKKITILGQGWMVMIRMTMMMTSPFDVAGVENVAFEAWFEIQSFVVPGNRDKVVGTRQQGWLTFFSYPQWCTTTYVQVFLHQGVLFAVIPARDSTPYRLPQFMSKQNRIFCMDSWGVGELSPKILFCLNNNPWMIAYNRPN